MSKKLQAEFIVRQYYTVLVDEDRIDEGRAHWQANPAEYIEAHFTRLHRMFNAIVANKKALSTIAEYQVLREHDANNDGMGTFLEVHYEKEAEPDFLDILMLVADCFTQEDKAEIERQIQSNREQHEQMEDGHFKGDGYYLEELAAAFKVEPSGWNIGPHVHPNG